MLIDTMLLDSASQTAPDADLILDDDLALVTPNAADRITVRFDGITVETVTIQPDARAEVRLCPKRYVLIVHESGERGAGETFLDGIQPSMLRNVARRLTVVPPGAMFHEWHELRTPLRLMLVYFELSKIAGDSTPQLADAPLKARLMFEDASLWSTIGKLRGSLDDEHCMARQYAAVLSAMIVHELLRLSAGGARIEPLAQGGLASWQKRTVVNYIEEHLAERIPLATLARLARLSPFHFCRAFKRSFGTPPGRYQNERRIERAKHLLVSGGASVTETALSVGFSETSSFCAAFRRETGITPRQFLRSNSTIPELRAIAA